MATWTATNMVRAMNAIRYRSAPSAAGASSSKAEVPPSAEGASSSTAGASSSHALLHNRFDLERRHEGKKEVLTRARKYLIDTEKIRVVSLGAEDGYMLEEAVNLFGDQAIYIGVEGGSLVRACEENGFVNRAKKIVEKLNEERQCKRKRNPEEEEEEDLKRQRLFKSKDEIVFHGMDKEMLFENIIERNHPVISEQNGLRTLCHLYDGGILPKQVIDQVMNVINRFKKDSVMIFVTTREKNNDERNPQADFVYIVKNMRRNGWTIKSNKKIYEVDHNPQPKTEIEEILNEPTMMALFFKYDQPPQ